jgi:hypothetical protein
VTEVGRPRAGDLTDSLIDLLEERILALEEAAADPAAAERLGQALRESADAHAYAGPTFAQRRSEAVRTGWLARISRRGDPRRRR